MGGGKGNSKTENTIRYAPYLESYHQTHLAAVKAFMDAATDDNPYEGYTELDFEDAFYGSGYVMSSYPTLYDMFGKFMAGLDVEILFDEIYEDTINGTVISNVISSEASILDDELTNKSYPRFDAGMRDINSVMSSTFVVGHAMMEAEKNKVLSRFSADLRAKVLPLVTERWGRHLEWNRNVINDYAQIMKFAISQKMDVDNHNLEMDAKRVLWPFNATQYMTSTLNALSGAMNTTAETAGASRAQKMIGGALAGAGTGAMVGAQWGAIGGPLGAGIGAGIGALLGLL